MCYLGFFYKFQNRRTKWKKQENVTHNETPDHKQNGTKTNQDFHSEPSPIATKTGKSVAAELNAKITAKQNSRLKQSINGGTKVNKQMDPPKIKTHGIPNKTSTTFNSHVTSHDLLEQFIDKSPTVKNSYHNFHDVESRLSVSKIPINDFKSKSTAPVALNLKRNYL